MRSSQLLHLVFCPRNGNLLLCYSTTKMRICSSQLHCIELNVAGTNFSINSYEKKSRALYRVTNRTTLFSRHAVHRTGHSSDDLRGVDRGEDACPPVAYISDLIRVSPHVFQFVEKWSPERNNNLRHRAEGHTQTKTRSTSSGPPMA